MEPKTENSELTTAAAAVAVGSWQELKTLNSKHRTQNLNRNRELRTENSEMERLRESEIRSVEPGTQNPEQPLCMTTK
jgi:hypothetical protein